MKYMPANFIVTTDQFDFGELSEVLKGLIVRCILSLEYMLMMEWVN